MEKYKDYRYIQKQHISNFRGLDTEVSYAPHKAIDDLPLWISKFGITYPNKDYYIKREPAPCFILEYVESGYGYLEINGERHKLGPGDSYMIHPGDYCTYYADKDDPYKKCWVNFVADFFFTEFLKAYKINDRIFRGMDLSGFFEKLFALEEEYPSNDELYIPAGRLIFGAVMDIAMHKQNSYLYSDRDLAYRVRNYLHRCICAPTTVEDLAKVFHHSKNNITRQFKKKYNTTPHSYLLEIRINKAKNLLAHSTKTLAEIAGLLCFSSEFHFSNTFKKRVGKSPSEFRKSIK